MNGCTTRDFAKKLKKLNPLLRVDYDRIAWTHPDYPECGLYYGNKYIYGVPQFFVPVHSIAGVNMEALQKRDDFDTLKYMDKYGFCPSDKQTLEEILWRGQKAILSDLCRRGYISEEKAKKEFKLDFFTRQFDYPRIYVQHITSQDFYVPYTR